MKPPVKLTTQQMHAQMTKQLGIEAIERGPSGDPKAPNHANYDEAKANPYPNLPKALVLNDGTKVTTAKMWWQRRRPQILKMYSKDVYGQVPKHVPGVRWQVKSTRHRSVGGHPVVVKRLIGHVDNSSYPSVNVNIQMIQVMPTDVKGPIPMLIRFGFLRYTLRSLGNGSKDPAYRNADGGPPPTWELINAGWGFAVIAPNSIQDDHGSGLTKGIIGLVNHGRVRTPARWGALRAWAWGGSQALTYLRKDPMVNGKQIGIEGVSRYGKAALVTMAYDRRFAMVLVGSSGKGGATPLRRHFGEEVATIAGAGEYHWMAGNFLKYAATKASFGSMNPGDIPVDSNELIALCAPRLAFISYGIPAKGDAKWLDQRGSWMATVDASEVWTLLGAKGLSLSQPEDYHTAPMPPVNHGLLGGKLAWRQDDGGHTDAPNTIYFIHWADKWLGYKKQPTH